MKQQKQETLMRRTNSEFELTNDAIRELSATLVGGTLAPRGTATSGLRRNSKLNSCRRCSVSSGTSSDWND